MHIYVVSPECIVISEWEQGSGRPQGRMLPMRGERWRAGYRRIPWQNNKALLEMHSDSVAVFAETTG